MSRPIVSVQVPIQQLAKHVYRLQAKGPQALADWLVALTDSLVDGDPARSEFGAELLAEARAFSDAKARAGRMGGEATRSSGKRSQSTAKQRFGIATAKHGTGAAKDSQSDRQTDQAGIQDPVQEEGSRITGGSRDRGAA